MPSIPKLTAKEIEAALPALKGWTVQKKKLHREYKFKDFIHAFGFMATAAIAIEKGNHHPEWSNVYGTVKVDLTTHDSGGITQADITLARTLESIAKKLK